MFGVRPQLVNYAKLIMKYIFILLVRDSNGGVFLRGNMSFILFALLIICGIWLHVKGVLFQFFNGGVWLDHIAREIDHDPFYRYGILLLFFLSMLVFFREWKRGRKKLRVTLLIVTSLLIMPLYSYIIFKEYKMETAPISDEIVFEINQRMDFAVLEGFRYKKDTKIIHVTLNYGTEKNNALEEYIGTEDVKSVNLQRKEHQIKQRLNGDLLHVIHVVWQNSHSPKKIVFNIKWGEPVLFTTTAEKRERYLSYTDSDESEDFYRQKKSLYDHLDVLRENEKIVIKLKTNNGNWLQVAQK